MRTNAHKDRIIAVLKKVHLLSLADIQRKLTGTDFSTIFRNVEQLCSDGTLRKIFINKDTTLYEFARNEKHHHDHFVCTDCGTIESVQLPQQIILKGKAIAIDVLIRGLCSGCNK